MKNTNADMQNLEREFQMCQKTLNAIGDETRQHLLLIMMSEACAGIRVIDIAKKTNLSRPAVSHHIQILKDAGIVKSRKEGTCIFYYLEPDNAKINDLISLFQDVKRIMRYAPDRSGGWQDETG